MAEILTPCCPLCGQLPMMVFGGGTQAFCGNDDCTILCWTPTLSLDDNLMDARHVQLPPAEDSADG
jgi:hypothetical protein